MGIAEPCPNSSRACSIGTNAAKMTSRAPKRYIIQLLHDAGSGVWSRLIYCLVLTLLGADVGSSSSTITSSYRSTRCTSSRLRNRTLCGRSRFVGVGGSSPFVSLVSPTSWKADFRLVFGAILNDLIRYRMSRSPPRMRGEVGTACRGSGCRYYYVRSMRQAIAETADRVWC